MTYIHVSFFWNSTLYFSIDFIFKYHKTKQGQTNNHGQKIYHSWIRYFFPLIKIDLSQNLNIKQIK